MSDRVLLRFEVLAVLHLSWLRLCFGADAGVAVFVVVVFYARRGREVALVLGVVLFVVANGGCMVLVVFFEAWVFCGVAASVSEVVDCGSSCLSFLLGLVPCGPVVG